MRKLRQLNIIQFLSDSTPDISHSDKLCGIFQYVLNSQTVERFVQFIETKGHGAAELKTTFALFLEKHQIKVTVEANHMIMDQT